MFNLTDNKYSKRIIVLLVLVQLLVITISGSAQERITLQVAHMHHPGSFPARYEAQLRFDEAFMEKYPHIEVERVIQPGGSFDWYVVNAAAGTLPDIFYVTWHHGHTLALQGVTMDLTNMIHQDPEFNYDDIFPVAQQPFLINDGIYGIAFDAGAVLPYFHGDFVREAGLAMPSSDWTTDDFLEYARRLTRRGSNGEVEVYGLARFYDAEVINAALGVFGGALLNDDETESLVTSPQSIEALEWWASLVIEEEVAPAPGMFDFNQLFMTGRAAMTFGGSWMLDAYTMQGEVDRLTNVVAFPTGPARQTATIAGSGYGISSSTAHAEAAWTYMREFMGEQNFKDMWARDGSPARLSAWPEFAQIWEERNPHVDVYAFLNAMDYGTYARPLGLNAGQISGKVQEELWIMLNGQRSPLASANTLHDEITVILSSSRE